MEEMAFITCRFSFSDSAGNIPSNIGWGNASQEVKVACIGGFQADGDQAEGVVQCSVKFLAWVDLSKTGHAYSVEE